MLNVGGTRLKGFRKFDKSKPLISIITVVFNGEKYLEQTIKSVINQDYENKEYIIVDGGSKDSTIDIIEKFEKNIDFWISEPDNGIYDAMNKGINLSQGDYIGIINSDDFYEENILNKLYSSFKEGPDIIHGDIAYLEKENIKMILKPVDKLRLDSFKEMPINHPTTFVHSRVYSAIGKYNLNYKIAADWEFTLRCFLSNKKFYYVPLTLANYRLGGVSSKKALECYREIFNTLLNKDLLPKWKIYLFWSQAIIKFALKGQEEMPILKELIAIYRKKKQRTSSFNNSSNDN